MIQYEKMWQKYEDKLHKQCQCQKQPDKGNKIDFSVGTSDLDLVKEARWFLGHFWKLLKRAVFFEAAERVAKLSQAWNQTSK